MSLKSATKTSKAVETDEQADTGADHNREIIKYKIFISCTKLEGARLIYRATIGEEDLHIETSCI